MYISKLMPSRLFKQAYTRLGQKIENNERFTKRFLISRKLSAYANGSLTNGITIQSFLCLLCDISLAGIFRFSFGKEWQKKSLHFSIFRKVQTIPKKFLFSSIVRSLGSGFVQSKLPAGVILQTEESAGDNYAIYRSRIYDLHYDIHDEDVIVDVGAHNGAFTLKAARKAKKGIVIAVEPYLPIYKVLMYNIGQNHFQNVIGVNEALSDFNGTSKLYIGSDNRQNTVLEERWAAIEHSPIEPAEIKTETLDSLAERLNLRKVDFLKINAEGSELHILKGAENLLKKYNVALAIAADHYATELDEIIEYLNKIGYVIRLGNSHHYVYAYRRRPEA